MKQIVRYRFMTIPSKLTGELRITIDERAAEYSSAFDGGRSTNISIFLIITVAISRPSEIDEKGNRVRPPWNPNDSIGLTKFNLPIFLDGLKAIMRGMKTPDLYTYHGSRLELNDTEAEKVRQVFMIGTTTLELTPIVINQLDDSKVEGIKMKFNNEQSTVLLTLNELNALIYNISSLNVDLLTFQLYTTYISKVHVKGNTKTRDPNPKQLVDVKPPEATSSFKEFEE